MGIFSLGMVGLGFMNAFALENFDHNYFYVVLDSCDDLYETLIADMVQKRIEVFKISLNELERVIQIKKPAEILYNSKSNSLQNFLVSKNIRKKEF